MFIGNRRKIFGASFVILLVFTITSCVPEKAVENHTKLVPKQWLSETKLLVRQGRELYQFSNGILVEYKGAVPQDINQTWNPEIPLLSREHPAFYYEDGHRYIDIKGEKHRANEPRFRRQRRGLNQLFPPMNAIPFQTYTHLGKVGLLTIYDNEVQKIELSIPQNGNWSGVAVVEDVQAKFLFAFQGDCYPGNQKGKCQRQGWWLNEKMAVISSIPLPEEDLLFTSEKLSCFSCGCGCYTYENIYAVDGNIYFHVSGFPISDSRRGLYAVKFGSDGAARWEQVIRGRIEPPLAFSPSGCKVAYMKVSRFGDKIDVTDLC